MITFELIRIIINYNKFRFTPDARLFLARLEVLHTSRVLGFGILTKLHQTTTTDTDTSRDDVGL